MWILIVLAVLCGLLLCPIQIIANYDSAGARVAIRYGLLIWTLYPASENKSGSKKKKTTKEQKKEDNAEQKTLEITKVIRILKMVLEPLDRLRRQIRINKLDLKLILANDDPCDLAVQYGRVWAVAADLQALLNRVFKVKKQNIDIRCDYLGNQTEVEFYTKISVPAGCILGLILRYGFGFIKEFRSIQNEGKGGMTDEQESS